MSTQDNTKMVRLQAKLPAFLVEHLREMAREQGITMTEALKRIITREELLFEESKKGSKVLIRDKKGEVRQLVIS